MGTVLGIIKSSYWIVKFWQSTLSPELQTCQQIDVNLIRPVRIMTINYTQHMIYVVKKIYKTAVILI